MPVRGHGWRVLAGAAFGLGVSVKWSGILPLIAGAAVAWVWELSWRKRVTGRRFTDLWPAVRGIALAFVLVPAAVYMLSYVPWFMNYAHTTEGRKVCVDDAQQPVEPCSVSMLGRIGGWARYQRAIFRFHRDLEADHPYRAHAITWPVLGRPVVYYWESCPENRANRVPETGEDGAVTIPDPCEVKQGEAGEIVALGNPALWWGFIGALVPLGVGMRRRDNRAWFIAAFWGMQFLPWLIVTRPAFYFYMTPVVPFLALGLSYATVWLDDRRAERVEAGLPRMSAVATRRAAFITTAAALLGGAVVLWRVRGVLGPYLLLGGTSVAFAWALDWLRRREPDPDDEGDEPVPPRRAGLSPGVLAGAAIAVVAVGLFIYFYPVLTGVPIPYDAWRQRMWFASWI